MSLTPGTNSYISLEDAEAYLTEHYPNAFWNASQEAMLKLAAQVIDNTPWHGSKADDEQVMEFPRHEETEVSQAVKYAQCEEAYAQLQAMNSSRAKLQLEGVTSVTVSKASESYDAYRMIALRRGKMLSPVARRLMRKYALGVAEIAR
jgi:hypothetical protein